MILGLFLSQSGRIVFLLRHIRSLEKKELNDRSLVLSMMKNVMAFFIVVDVICLYFPLRQNLIVALDGLAFGNL